MRTRADFPGFTEDGWVFQVTRCWSRDPSMFGFNHYSIYNDGIGPVNHMITGCNA